METRSKKRKARSPGKSGKRTRLTEASPAPENGESTVQYQHMSENRFPGPTGAVATSAANKDANTGTIDALGSQLLPNKNPSSEPSFISTRAPAGGNNDEDIMPISVRAPTMPAFDSDTQARLLENATHDRSMGRLRAVDAMGTSVPRQRSPSTRSMTTTVSVPPSKRRDDIFPRAIKASVYLTFDDQEICNRQKIRDFEWFKREQYILRMDQWPILKEYQSRTPQIATQSIYFRYGSCDIKGPAGLYYTGKYSNLDDDHVDGDSFVLAEKSIVNICGFIHDYEHEPFSLRVHFAYSSAQLTPLADSKEPFAATIKHEVERKKVRNFRGQEYVARCDLAGFTALGVITELVLEDRPLNDSGQEMNDAEAKQFARDVWRLNASKLFIICIFTEKGVKFFQHLFRDHGFHDKNLPPHGTHCQKSTAMCPFRIADIVKCIPAFSVDMIKYNFQNQEWEDEYVMPISHSTGTTKGYLLGPGAQGRVYKVFIHPAHHKISGNPRSEYAMKVFPGRQCDQVNFEREKDMLTALANNPHQHIVPHITTWSQFGDFHILYPKASYDLRGFMAANDPPGLGENGAIWFMKQLHGLADALMKVHHYKRPTTANPHPEDELWGCHHDIKPENILVFENKPNTHPLFKIGDFGCGRFRPAKQNGVSELTMAVGTRAYLAPEGRHSMPVSRPFDMWGLGCVFLELLTWFFSESHRDSGKFSDERGVYTGMDPRNSDDGFWQEVQVNGKSTCRLKTSVSNKLRDLETVYCREIKPFERLISAVRRLLHIEPGGRLKAAELVETLDGIVKEVEAQIAANRFCYKNLHERNLRTQEGDLGRQGRGSLESQDVIHMTGTADNVGDGMSADSNKLQVSASSPANYPMQIEVENSAPAPEPNGESVK